MDHNQANVPSGSQGPSPYQQQWSPYMYAPYQCPPSWNQQVPTNFRSGSGPQQFQPAVMADTSKQSYQADAFKETDEADLYQCADPPVPSPSAPRRRKKMATRVKLSNFLPDEDVNLVKAWLEISTDPITNTSQRREGMWERILQRYNMRRGSYDERTVRSLQSRWDTIKTEVGKFCAYYADAVRENASGTSDADKTTMVAANYASIQKHSFGYMHCWELMKDEPKWQDPKSRVTSRSAAGEGFGDDTHHGADAEHTEDHNYSPTGTAATRPMGRDSAKAAKKTANSSAGSAASAEYAAKQQEIRQRRLAIMEEDSEAKKNRFQQQTNYNMSLLSIEQEKMQMMRDRYEMEKLEKQKQEDERILAIDIDKCLPSQRLYYQMAQEEIVERLAAKRMAQQAP